MSRNFYKEHLSLCHRLDGLERVIAPPDLRMIVIDHNKPDDDLPVVDKLTQWDLVLEIERKSPIHANTDTAFLS